MRKNSVECHGVMPRVLVSVRFYKHRRAGTTYPNIPWQVHLTPHIPRRLAGA